MPNPRPGGLPAVTLVLFLLAAGCTPSGHPPGTRGQAPYQESSAAAAGYLAAAEPANRRLDAGVQTYAHHDHIRASFPPAPGRPWLLWHAFLS